MRRLFVSCLFVIAGCITPSIPIPPPDPALMTFHLTGIGADLSAVFSYPSQHNYHNGVAYVYNRTKGTGVIKNVNTDDSIGPTAAFPAVVGDEVVVSVETVNQTESTCVKLRDGTGQDANGCTF